jgi:two-component system CheB/CheR fusion protein
LSALEKFFVNLPPTTGLGFVIVTHLDPEHKSLLPELLERHSSIPLHTAEDGRSIEPDSAYFIPPNTDLEIQGGKLHLLPPARLKRQRHPIDSFLHSLAEDQGEKAICIILSGSGTDGSLGLKTIKDQGGLVMVQDEKSAQYAGMPSSAMATGLVDLSLRIEELPAKLVEYVRFLDQAAQAKHPEPAIPDLSKQLPRILSIINNQSKLDVTNFKPSLVMRSIERRMLLVSKKTPIEYVDHLISSPQEAAILVKDLLSCVTIFFRDPKTYEVLKKKVIPNIFKDRTAEQPIRVWVAGCCTGEEAYSIAMLLLEHQEKSKDKIPIQIFATDINENALDIARNGLYPANITTTVSAKRLKTFFRKIDDNYKICKELRESIIFAPHNLLHDPPFAKLDLISCRQMLIQLKPMMQKKILDRFYYGLNPGSFLLFGNEDTSISEHELFSRIDKKWQIAQQKIAIFSTKSDGSATAGKHFTPDLEMFSALLPATDFDLGLYAADKLQKSYAPPCVVINKEYEVVHFSTRTSRYLHPPVGRPTLNLLKIAGKWQIVNKIYAMDRICSASRHNDL